MELVGGFIDYFLWIFVVRFVLWTEIYEKPRTVQPQRMDSLLQLLSSRRVYLLRCRRINYRVFTEIFPQM